MVNTREDQTRTVAATVTDDDVDLAVRLVTEAGRLALRMRSEGLTGERKTSVSDVVTAADHAAEELVRTELARQRPDDGILGEEGTSRPGTSGRTWVIDPVDGTYNFLHGSSYWCSALALRDDTAPAHPGDNRADAVDPSALLGVVYHPQEDALWCGGAGLPTTCNGIRVSVAEDLPPSALGLGSYLHPTRYSLPEIVDPWMRAASQAATVRMMGSGSVDLAHVAGGRLGYWFQLGCPQWDWLPGKALIRAAGGTTRVVTVNDVNWFVAGPPRAVEAACAALEGRG